MILMGAIAGALLGAATTVVRRRKIWVMFALLMVVIASIAIWAGFNRSSLVVMNGFVGFGLSFATAALVLEYLLRWHQQRTGRSLGLNAPSDGGANAPTAQ